MEGEVGWDEAAVLPGCVVWKGQGADKRSWKEEERWRHELVLVRNRTQRVHGMIIFKENFFDRLFFYKISDVFFNYVYFFVFNKYLSYLIAAMMTFILKYVLN